MMKASKLALPAVLAGLVLVSAPAVADPGWDKHKHGKQQGHSHRHHDDRRDRDHHNPWSYRDRRDHDRNGHHDRHAHRDDRHRHRYSYVYYPRHQAYYAPDRHRWYWCEGTRWYSGARLPTHLASVVNVGGVSVFLDTGRPYERHSEVRHHYGYR